MDVPSLMCCAFFLAYFSAAFLLCLFLPRLFGTEQHSSNAVLFFKQHSIAAVLCCAVLCYAVLQTAQHSTAQQPFYAVRRIAVKGKAQRAKPKGQSPKGKAQRTKPKGQSPKPKAQNPNSRGRCFAAVPKSSTAEGGKLKGYQ